MDDDHALELVARLETLHHALDLVPQIQHLAVVQRPVVKEDELGVDLHRPLQEAPDAHIRRRAAEHAAEPHRRQQDNKRLRGVTTNHDDAITNSDPPLLQRTRQLPDPAPQLPPTHMPNLCTTLPNLRHGDPVVLLVQRRPRPGLLGAPRPAPEQILRQVETHTLEPAGQPVDGHGLIDDGREGALVDPALVVPQLAVELDPLLAGPRVQLLEGLQVEVVALVGLLHELPHDRALGVGMLPELPRHGSQVHDADEY